MAVPRINVITGAMEAEEVRCAWQVRYITAAVINSLRAIQLDVQMTPPSGPKEVNATRLKVQRQFEKIHLGEKIVVVTEYENECAKKSVEELCAVRDELEAADVLFARGV